MLPEAPRLAVELDLNVLLYTGVVSIAATMLFGLVPALHATRIDVAPLLKSDDAGAGSARRGGRIRTFFLVTQFAASTALLIAAGTFVRTVVTTHLGEAGRVDGSHDARVDRRRADSAGRARRILATVRQRIREVPGVTALTLSAAGGERTVQLTVDGLAADERVAARVQRVDAGFFQMSDVAVIQGTDLPRMAGDSADALVNERAARQLRLGTATIGPRLMLDESGRLRWSASFVTTAPKDGSISDWPMPTSPRANVLIRTERPAAAAVGAIRSAIAAGRHRPRTSTNVATLREASTGMLQRLTGMALVVAMLALSLAAVGLYGSVAFITAQRTSEIAIRIAVGAPRSTVLRMLVWEGGYVVLPAVPPAWR